MSAMAHSKDETQMSVRHAAPTCELVSLIIEFLQFHNFARTLQALEVDWKAAETQVAEGIISARGLSKNLTELMSSALGIQLQAFDQGQTEAFFDMWRQAVPASFLEYHDFSMKLEFGLQVHFALWPLMMSKDQHDKLDMLKRMSNFKTYLETRGAVLVSHADFLPYYALPHVPEPESHPSFQHLLDPQCTAAQRIQLEDFLNALPDRCNQPRLYSLLPSSITRACSSRSVAAVSTSSPDPAALLTGEETLDSFIGKTPVNMSYEKPSTAAHLDQLQNPCSDEGQPLSALPGSQALPLASGDSEAEPMPSEGHVTRMSVEAVDQELSEPLGASVVKTTSATGAPAPDADVGRDSTGSKKDVAGGDAAGPSPPALSEPSESPHLAHSAQHGAASGAVEPETNRRSASAQVLSPTLENTRQLAAVELGSASTPALPGPQHMADMVSAEVCTGGPRDSMANSVLRSNRASVEGPFAEHSLVSAAQVPPEAAVRRSITRTAQEQAQLPAIAWDLVKRQLWSADSVLRAALLQAIRWRLIRSPAGTQRRLVLQVLIDHNILGCGDTGQPSLIASIIGLEDAALTTQLLRLISVMASDHKGRGYLLASGGTVVPDLFGVLSTMPVTAMHRKEGDEVIDTEVHQLALAALQKLSLRRVAQEALVAAGMVPWVATYLRMHETLSEHAVEYSMAMLMNCCLCRSGRKACEGLDILGTLDGLVQVAANRQPCMQATNPEVRTYVNGTIYSLLSRQAFKTQAHERGLPDMLTAISELSEPVFQNQIAHILTHLGHAAENDSEPEWLSDASGADDLGIDTMDYVDEYDDVHQAVPPGQMLGEALLQSYLAAPTQVQEQSSLLRRSLSQAAPTNTSTSVRSSKNTDVPFTRPMTPTHAGARAAGAAATATDSPLTMQTKAIKAAQNVKPGVGMAGDAEEYIEAFGPKRELPRTPKLHSGR